MIPAAAIEAAARVIVRTVVERSWESLLPSRQEWYKVQARLTLEAAAPGMFAQALEEAVHMRSRWKPSTHQTTPSSG